jgi:hypothetical protein
MIRFRAANLKFNGDYPTNRQVRDKLIASGFFRHLYDKVRNEDKYNLSESGGLIYTHALKIVDSVQADLIVKDASQFIWGTPQRCLGVQRTFVELMQNTHNHASQKRKGEHHWWVSLSKDESKKNVSISFLDFGLGIFNSLFNKKEGDQFYGWQQNMYKLFPLSKSNDQLLRLILKGELHKSATKKLYRGKGLPGIYEAAQNNKISALHIISNNVSANIERDDYHLLKNSFDGTLVSFEINYNTIHFPWTI